MSHPNAYVYNIEAIPAYCRGNSWISGIKFNGYRYILVICDYTTRFPEAFPLMGIKGRQLVTALVQLFSRMGFPKENLTY